MLTQEEYIEKNEEYIKRGGVICPYCESDNIRPTTRPQESGGDFYQDIVCGDCKKIWTDVYSLIKFEEIEI